jgi:hypothetical protein
MNILGTDKIGECHAAEECNQIPPSHGLGAYNGSRRRQNVFRPAALLDANVAKPFKLSIATPAYDCGINALRQKAYAAAGYFSLPDPSTVLREADPPRSICLIVSNGSEIASTVRLTPAQDREEAEEILEAEVTLPAHHFPALAMCRGATEPKYRGVGLMSFLVSVGVEIAHRANLGSALGTQYEGTSHYPAMKAAGWNRFPINDALMRTVRSLAPLYLVYIARDRFKSSIAHSLYAHGQLYRRFNVEEVVFDSAQQIIGRGL